MEALIKIDDPADTFMEDYLSCPICQRNFLSADRFQEHNCHVQRSSSSFYIPSHSSLNPRALDLNIHSEAFPFRQETIEQPSLSPQNVQLESSTHDQNIPRRSRKGRLSPEETSLFTCGICKESFNNFDVLKCHMLTSHTEAEELQAEELEKISTPVHDNISSVQSTSEAVQLPEQVEEHEATSNMSGNSNASTKKKGLAPRYPRNSRFVHQQKFHSDAYRSIMLTTNLAEDRLSEKANETSSNRQVQENPVQKKKAYDEASSTQMKENFDKETDMDARPDFPFVEVNGIKYFWCDIPDCGLVLTNLNAMYLHHENHQTRSAETVPTIAQNSIEFHSNKSKVMQEGRKQLHVKSRKIAVDRDQDQEDFLDQTMTTPNHPQMSATVMQEDDKEMTAQSPMQYEVGMLKCKCKLCKFML